MAFLSNLEMGRGCGAAKYLKQIKYQMLVVVHPQSDENVRLQWGFLTIFYKYIIKSHKRRFISVQLGNGEGVWGGDGDALWRAPI